MYIVLRGRWCNTIFLNVHARRSSLLDVQCFRRRDCYTDHFLVAAKFRERLAVSKKEARKCDVEGCKLRTLNELEVRKQ